MPSAATPHRTSNRHPLQDRTLGYLLREVYGRLQERVYDTVAASGHPELRPMHSPVLRHLAPDGGRVADLARATGLAKQSVSYVVDHLVALGYLRIEADPDDGRARRVVYTALGHRLLAALVSASRKAESELASTLGVQRLQSLRDTLERVLDEPRPGPRPAATTRSRRPLRA